jgi:hypothetical protein
MALGVQNVSTDLSYLIGEIRSNLESTENVARAQAWLLTTLSFYGDQLVVLVDLYRLCREQKAYGLLSFIIDYLLRHRSNELEHERYLQEEFQQIFSVPVSR